MGRELGGEGDMPVIEVREPGVGDELEGASI